MIKYILWDIDNTILDFKSAETAAMNLGFDKYGITIKDPEALGHYNMINDKLWKKLELGELSRDEVLKGRFAEFFDLYKIKYDQDLITNFNIDFQKELGNQIFFNPGAKDALRSLSKDFKLVAVTNGTKLAQTGKLKNSGLDKVFDKVFISEDVGVDKPYKEFFDKVFEEIGSKNPDEYIIIGDSLTSDIKGGNNANIKTIWYNPDAKDNYLDVQVDFDIRHLSEVVDIIYDIDQ